MSAVSGRATPDPQHGSTACSVWNDLALPIEVKTDVGWQILYPTRSIPLEGELVEVRLREDVRLQGSCPWARQLSASLSFGEFSTEAKRRQEADMLEVKQEARRKKAAKARQLTKLEQAVKAKWNEDSRTARCHCLLLVLAVAIVVTCAMVPPGSAVVAALLSSAVFVSCCFITYDAGKLVADNGWRISPSDICFARGRLRFCTVLSWMLGLLGLIILTLRHSFDGFWWTSLITLPAYCFGCNCLRKMCYGDEVVGVNMSYLTRAHQQSAEHELLRKLRSIEFNGSVLKGRGRACVCSWPGKYAGAWDALVDASVDGEISAAVVFLPDGTEEYGVHDAIPPHEHLEGKCWCTVLYGEEKPWGCRWFSRWKANIEEAVDCGAELQVYFCQGRLGQGRVQEFQTAGAENLRRESLNSKRKDFEGSLKFQKAFQSGLDLLQVEPRGDGSSQYSRELQRLFWASLPAEDREFLEASEGLGTSQKAEVAWLERKGYPYCPLDVSTWLARDDGVVHPKTHIDVMCV
ncbi:unnamed protein product [Symbiodinium sp. CCMP2592]|nr:unnamed protein product [Symbiodinium sp. CCMP2592]